MTIVESKNLSLIRRPDILISWVLGILLLLYYLAFPIRDISYDGLKYAKETDSGRDVSYIDQQGWSGERNSIALDTYNYLHVVYHKNVTGTEMLVYAKYEDGTWNKVTIESSPRMKLVFFAQLQSIMTKICHILSI